MSPNTEIPLAPGWSEARWKQLFELEKLLNEVTMINHGSQALDRIQRCIEIAQKLRHDDLSECFVSLPSFLKERALGRQGTA